MRQALWIPGRRSSCRRPRHRRSWSGRCTWPRGRPAVVRRQAAVPRRPLAALDGRRDDPVGHPRAAGRPRRARRGDARARRRLLPGRLPQPARRPVPARGRRRRRPRGDDRGRLHARARYCCRRQRSSAGPSPSSLAYAIGRSAGRGSGGATLVLAGVTVASFFTAVQTFVQQQHSDTLQQVYSWILGALPSSGWHRGRRAAAVRRGRDRRDPAPPPAARRDERRRRGGGEPRRPRRPGAARGRRLRDRRHGRRGRRQPG